MDNLEILKVIFLVLGGICAFFLIKASLNELAELLNQLDDNEQFEE